MKAQNTKAQLNVKTRELNLTEAQAAAGGATAIEMSGSYNPLSSLSYGSLGGLRSPQPPVGSGS